LNPGGILDGQQVVDQFIVEASMIELVALVLELGERPS